MVIVMKSSMFKRIYIYCAIVAVFYFWFAAQIPYSHDDWDWGTDTGIYWWLTADQNSRYAGNLFEILMTRSELLKTMIVGTGCFLIPLLITQISCQMLSMDHPRMKCLFFLLGNALILSMDRAIWKQTYGWIAGYANFVLSGIYMLYLLRETLPVLTEDSLQSSSSFGYCIWILLISFTGQLFLENLALYMVLYAFLLCGVSLKKYHRISRRELALLAGVILGLVIMFSSGLYKTLFSSGKAINGYRRVYLNAEDGLLLTMINCLKQFIRLPYHIWENNLVLSLTTLAVMSLKLLRAPCRKSTISRICMIGNLVCAVYFLIHHFVPLPGELEMYQTANGSANIIFHSITFCMNMIYFISITVQILLTAPKKKERIGLLFFWLSALAVIAPLIFISEYGSRLFFSSNLFLILFVILQLSSLLQHSNERCVRKCLLVAAAVTAILILFHGVIYYEIGLCKAQRDEQISNAILYDAKQLSLPQYPWSHYLQYPDPFSEARLTSFKKFYGLPMDISIDYYIFKRP